jgi:putative DNA primase/helicase
MPSEARAREQVAPKELQVQPEHIPAELRRYAQWICWRYVDRGEGKKPDKQPVNPHNLHNAGVHWPNTWTNFEHAYMTYLAYRNRGLRGIGFVLTTTDPFVGVDLDHCVVDGKVAPEAQAIVDHLGSYTETSPSGQGLRILVTSPGFVGNMRRQALEIYSHSRFVTLTGHHLEGTPATISAVDADAIRALILQEGDAKPHSATPRGDHAPQDLDGMALWERIFEHDRFGAQHRRRFAGDMSLDGGDHSLTVIRLLNCLARWTQGDAVKMRAMILMAPLANEKWLSKRGEGNWLDHQIDDAIRYLAGIL